MTLLLGLLLDLVLGEPRRWHPLVGFGALVNRVESLLNPVSVDARAARCRGLLAWLLLVVPVPGLVWLLSRSLDGYALLLFEAAVLWLCLGGRSLARHAAAVAVPLESGDLEAARREVAKLVSRDCDALGEGGVTRATIESVLENSSDAVIATLFWFAVAGAPAALVHRLANTLDACWGYRTPRFLLFGQFAARADDLLNYLPARLCALAFVLMGRSRGALRCWRRQSRRLSSPNAGPVMTAGAGALGIWVGGPANYHGQLVERPIIGCGREAGPADIYRANNLMWRAAALCSLLGLLLLWWRGGGFAGV